VGRKPIGRRALSAGQKQQRYRDRLKRAQLQGDKDAIYAKAKAKRDAVHARLADASIAAAAQLEAQHRFPLVVMDPGTRFDVRSERGMNRSSPSNHYTTETWAKLSSDPPPLHDHALLLCWATQANCHLMMRIVEDRSGLTIKSLFTWDKMIIGMGYWGRSQYEYLIVATKGRGLRVPLPSHRTPNGFIEKARRGPGGHSRKPVAFYQWVEANYANVPKLEMNCRYPRNGWSTSGNEAALSLTLDEQWQREKPH
jgi:N6-adenosine-specific RNA methylase IME4